MTERRRVYCARYRRENSDKIKAYKAAWIERNRMRRSNYSRLSFLRKLEDPTPAQVKEMIRRMAMYKKRTHCRRGHKYPEGKTACYECRLIACREWRSRNRDYFVRWQKENRDRINMLARIRRAKAGRGN